MSINYVTRDNFGMYANANASEGPDPALVGADTLLDSGVYNKDGEDLAPNLGQRRAQVLRHALQR